MCVCFMGEREQWGWGGWSGTAGNWRMRPFLSVKILKRCLLFSSLGLYHRFSCWCPLFSHCGCSVSSSILPSLCLSSENDVMAEAMCEMPVLPPQVMFDGNPLAHQLLEGLRWNEASQSDMGRFGGIFEQLLAVSSKVEINASYCCITSLYTKCCSLHI